MRQLHEAVVAPIAVPQTRGAWYRGWRLVSLDGSTLEVADERTNEEAFGRPGASRGASAYPQIRFVSLVENGTHVLFASRMAGYGTSEIALAHSVLEDLRNGMLCLADRQFFSFAMWGEARESGADLLWRIKKNARLPRETVFVDGSYLSRIYPSERDRRHKQGGVTVRVVDDRLEGRRADLPSGDHHPRSRARPCRGAGGPLSRTLGDRDRLRRAEDTSARCPDRLAQPRPRTSSVRSSTAC